MPTVEVTIINRLGLHARAAAQFVQAASRYGSEISVERDDKTVNGKSIMGVMMLAASQGTTLKISATGDDADVALSEIVGLVNSRFGEPS